MAQKHQQTLPLKCKQCEKPLSAPPVCDFCKALNPIPAVSDYFTLLGVPRRFDIDEGQLQRQFFSLSRHTHPDYHTSDSPEAQQLALKVSAAINDAYRTLKDPACRASYLLELLGGASSAGDKSVPEGFLSTMMMMQEELAEAKASSDDDAIERLAHVLQTQHDGLLKRIAASFQQHQEAVMCEAVRSDVLEEIRRQLNALSYVKKLLSQV